IGLLVATAVAIVLWLSLAEHLGKMPETWRNLWKLRPSFLRRSPTAGVGARQDGEEFWDYATRKLDQAVRGHWAKEAKWRGLSEDRERIRVTWRIDRERIPP